MSTPERTYSLRAPSMQVVDPSHPQAEADALAWGVGVVSLSPTQFVYNDGSALVGEQTVDIPDGYLVACYQGTVTLMSPDALDARWEYDPSAGAL